MIPVGFMLATIVLMHYHWQFVSYKLFLVLISAVLVTVATTGFLPLFSYDGSVTIISYVFVGILLSIYRNLNLIDETRPKRFRIRLKLEQE